MMQVLGAVRQLDLDFALLEPLHQTLELDVDDHPHLRPGEGVEHDDFIDAVQELGPELRAQRIEHLALRPCVERAFVGIAR